MRESHYVACDPESMLSAVRARIAAELLGPDSPRQVGQITLHPHQRQAAHRLEQLLRIRGGAMLADATGLGKTFVALAIAANFERAVIVAPAALTDAWHHAMARTGVSAQFISLERLSRGRSPAPYDYDLVIVDEAHHLRNCRTKRYQAVVALCDRKQVLLLTATPLQNRRDDLIAQLALFLGDAAYTASDVELARLIVRRSSAESRVHLPTLRGPDRIDLETTDDLLDEILGLPSPVPGADEGEAAALVMYTLMRQWASSRAALLASLRRRLAKAVALATSLENGRWPTRNELAAWSCADEVMQLALPELLAPSGGAAPCDLQTLLFSVRAHLDALRAVIARVRATPDPDRARAVALARVCQKHPGARILAFSQFAETVHVLSRLLMSRQAGVATLTATGGRVAGGRLSRRDVLAQFSPASRPAITRAEQIDLLVTTDVLSEGLDLQRASVVIHLDLPWNPARLEQRVGRVRRIGSEHREIFVYAFAPPAAADRVLRIEKRLRMKLGIAARVVGLDGGSIESATSVVAAPPELASRTLGIIERWRTKARPSDSESTDYVHGAVLAPNEGFLALITLDGEPMLVAALDGGRVTTDPEFTALIAEWCEGTPVSPQPGDIVTATNAIRGWLEHRAARRDLGAMSANGAQLRRRVATLITELLGAAPRHRRVALVARASAARHALRAPLGAAGERSLAFLARAERRDAGWLEDIAGLASGRPVRRAEVEGARILSLIVLRRASEQSAGPTEPVAPPRVSPGA